MSDQSGMLVATVDEALDVAARLYHEQDLARALHICREVLAVEPWNRRATNLLGIAARQAGLWNESIEAFRRAIAIEPGNAQFHFELGNSLREAGSRDEAGICYRQALDLDPAHQPACTNLAATLQQMDRYEDSLPWTLRAVELNPECKIANYNLGHAQAALGHPEEAVLAYERALALEPDYAQAHWNLAVAHLLAGNFREGWREFEWRVASGEVMLDQYAQPVWDGSSLAGKSILIHPEQGIGDEILFASCFGDVIRQARQCVIVCEPRLANLFARSFPNAVVQGYQRRKDWAPARIQEAVDWRIPAGSLPRFFRPDQRSFPERDHYLVADATRRAAWKSRFSRLHPGPKVGIAWRAGGKPSESRRRTIPLSEWREILSVPGVTFFNLQYGDDSDELRAMERELGITIQDGAEADPLSDLDEYAAKISALDLVISVGNATVHMAGALGVPVWAMLPLVPSWRWLQRGETSPWYASARLFRQSRRNDWRDVIAGVSAKLHEYVGIPRQEIPAATPEVSTMQPVQEGAGEPDDPRVSACLVALETPSDTTVAQCLQTAMELQRQRNFGQTEKIYREILRVVPRHTDALHLLGVLARQTGRADLAVRSIQRAINVGPASAVMHYNLGLALTDSRDWTAAARNYEQALSLDAGLVDARLNLGTVYQQLGGWDLAIDCFQKVLASAPTRADAWLNLGRAWQQVCRPDEAVKAFEQAISAQPEYAQAHNALGALYLSAERYQESIPHFRRAIACKADSVSAMNNLATSLVALGNFDEAIEFYERTVKLDANCFQAWANLASALEKRGDSQEAIQAYQQAIALNARCPETLNNLGMIYLEHGNFQAALDFFGRSLAIWPDYATARANRAMALLQMGQFEEGWREYDWRWKCETGSLPRGRLPAPEWDGSSLAKKTILIHGEQGVGDEVMFATCYPELIARARHCVISCDPRLLSLFARSFPRASFIGVLRGTEHEWTGPREPTIDVQIAAGSVPRFCRTTLASFPRQERLLKPFAPRVELWRQRFAELGAGLKVGIAWRGGTKPQDRRLRWTRLQQWKSLLTLPGVQFINLQYDDCRQEIEQARRDWGVTIHTWDDFSPTQDLEMLGAQIAALDLVLSVGNAGVHLAGALGIRAWAILPCFHGWRWLTSREDTPWYASVRLFRQDEPGAWERVFARVERELLDLARRHSAGMSGHRPHWSAELSLPSAQPAAPTIH